VELINYNNYNNKCKQTFITSVDGEQRTIDLWLDKQPASSQTIVEHPLDIAQAGGATVIVGFVVGSIVIVIL